MYLYYIRVQTNKPIRNYVYGNDIKYVNISIIYLRINSHNKKRERMKKKDYGFMLIRSFFLL